ncbi:Ger(x)C family spore germination protein [Brevibacillus sp. SYSU BS000544]|uniref:Ger(x)C family spore germination protein n=1 Tax=Brevibacillus sp. SYSU BS000544 TaxID=3416443 RepID=UPI003CE4887F
MKRTQFILFVLLPSLLISGCWDRVELNDLAIITAAAIDAKKDNKIELTIQVFAPRSLSGGGITGGGSTENLTLVRSGEGINMADAMSKLQTKLPRRLFWGHCKVYVFGEEMAKRGIAREMDFLLRHPEPRERSYMYISKGEASTIMELMPPLERYSGEVLRELSDLRIGMTVTMKDLQVMLREDSKSAILPFVEILPQRKNEMKLHTIPFLFGSAVFHKDKMIGRLSQRETRGVLWIRNDIITTTVSVKTEENKGSISLQPVKETTKLVPEINEGKWIMNINIEAEGDLVQNETNLDLLNPQLLRKIEKDVRQDIVRRVEIALNRVQKEMKADVFGFGEAFHRKYPKEWAKVKDNWTETFVKLEVHTHVKAYIKRPGLINVPGAIPENEVQTK